MMPKAQDIINNLFRTPKKEKGDERPHYYKTGIAGRMQEADVLFLPETDEGYKYLLVVTDIGTRRVDAEPLKKKDSKAVASAFGKIYKRKILPIPEKIRVDAGNEFKGDTLQWLTNKDINVRVAIVGRHRQMANVESKNKIIGRALFKKITAVELLTGKESKNWLRFLKPLIKTMNEQANKIKVHKDDMKNDMVKLPSKQKEFLKIGQIVSSIRQSPRLFNRQAFTRKISKF